MNRRSFFGLTAGATAAGLLGWFGRMRFRPQRRLESKAATIAATGLDSPIWRVYRIKGGKCSPEPIGHFVMAEGKAIPLAGWQPIA